MAGDRARDLIQQAYQARFQGLPDRAYQLFTEAVDLSREAGDRQALAAALFGRGQIERDQGDRAAAIQSFAEGIAILQSSGEPLALAHAVRHLADILRELHRLEQAESHYLKARAIYRENPEAKPLDVANTIAGLARLKEDEGNPSAARSLWHEARELYLECGVQGGVTERDAHLARTA